MKKLVLLSLLTWFSLSNVKAQFIYCDKADLSIDPSETVSVILTDNDAINQQIIQVMETSWTVCKYQYTSIAEIAAGGLKSKYYMLAVREASADFATGYSTNFAYYKFGESNTDMSKAIAKYSKDQNERTIIYALGSNLVRAYMDPSNIDNNFVHFTSANSGGMSNISSPQIIDKNGIRYTKMGRSIPPNELLKAKEYVNFIGVAIKNINWMLNKHAQQVAETNKSYKDWTTGVTMYNKNSCDLKNMTLLISSDYTIKGSKLDATKKNFVLSECKAFYKYKTEIVDSDKISEYTKSDSAGKYAVLIQGIWERRSICLIYRLSDGALLFGSQNALTMSPGFGNSTYKSFEDVCH